jgi:hypothetical protein
MVLRIRNLSRGRSVFGRTLQSQLTLDLLDDILRVSDGLCLSKWIGFTSRTSPKRRWVENKLYEASIGETKKSEIMLHFH